MKVLRMTAKAWLLLVPAFLAVIVITTTIVLRNTQPSRSDRDRAELEALANVHQGAAPPDVGGLVLELRKAGENTGGRPAGVPSDSRKIKDELRRAGDAALPAVRKAIFDSAEPILLRMELVGVAAEGKTPASESLATEVFSDRSLDGRLRTVALSKLTGRSSEPFFQALKKSYEEEPEYGSRHLVLRAISETRHREALPILLDASRKEPSASARIQAVDGLGERVSDPGAFQALREAVSRDPEENVRLAAISAIARSSDPPASEALREISQNPELSASLKKAAASRLEAHRAPR